MQAWALPSGHQDYLTDHSLRTAKSQLKSWNWDRQRAVSLNDIYHIEAVGPLAILTTFPKVITGSFWLHFIDNVAAEYSIIRGSSSVEAGDIVIGLTWKKIRGLNTFMYVDRVASESNPVDGLSRGRMDDPWKQVLQAALPNDLLVQLRAAAAAASESDLK